jgi:CSLREA domain-containing protein
MSTKVSGPKTVCANKLLRMSLSTFLLLVLLFGGLPVPRVQAATTWTVTSAADTDDGVCDRDCTLREALNSASSGDTINFSRNQTVTLRSPLPSINHRMIIKGRGANQTIIQASACNPVTRAGRCESAAYRVFFVETSGNLTLDGVTVRHGSCDNSCGTSSGGGISNRGTLSLKNSNILFNRAAAAGGGLDNDGGKLTLTNSTVSANAANLGGGLHNAGSLTITNSTVSANTSTSFAGGLSNTGSATLKESHFLANSADADGGGVYNSGRLTITGGAFFGNRADNLGGGIYSTAGDMRMTGAAVSGNSGYNGGGGIYNLSVLTVKDGMFYGNRGNNTSNYGGGIFNDGNGTLTVTASSFYNNTAYGGGGINNLGTLEMKDSEFIGNTAYYIGGGISNSSSANLEHTNFYNNHASSFGGGIWNGSALIAVSLILYDNSAPTGPSIQDDGETYFSNTVMDP